MVGQREGGERERGERGRERERERESGFHVGLQGILEPVLTSHHHQLIRPFYSTSPQLNITADLYTRSQLQGPNTHTPYRVHTHTIQGLQTHTHTHTHTH